LTGSKQSTFDRYADRLLAENQRAGLTSSGTDREAIYRRHFAESLALLEALEVRGEVPDAARIIDVGSGGGFPGIPIAIVRPQHHVTLLEATAKKADFLRAMAAELVLDNVTVVQARAEEAGRDPEHRESYDLVLARALAPLPVLIEITVPFLKVGGLVAAPKGSAAPREIGEATHALAELGSEIVETGPLVVEGGVGPVPTLILIRKHAATVERYPRRTGIPKKRPL
jgi:16S rRNA (guanine527-N7)-methyltransferase